MKGETNNTRLAVLMLVLVGILFYWITTPVDIPETGEVLGRISGYKQIERDLLTYLDNYSENDSIKREIVSAILTQAAVHKIHPEIIVSVLTYENWTLNPFAISSAGATGLMQVMPLHLPMGTCGATRREDLYSVSINICMGVQILQKSLDRCNGVMRCALLTYNGCVVQETGNFKACYGYPSRIEDRMVLYLSPES